MTRKRCAVCTVLPGLGQHKPVSLPRFLTDFSRPPKCVIDKLPTELLMQIFSFVANVDDPNAAEVLFMCARECATSGGSSSGTRPHSSGHGFLGSTRSKDSKVASSSTNSNLRKTCPSTW
ncbi:hypothetical protein B0H10DRAFT_762882 [Mycena sp. CBHHK59/15]|nr:hypothetical protein B0H10DRAFT_762882 [Mycena sp. CBHHK59/15]